MNPELNYESEIKRQTKNRCKIAPILVFQIYEFT